MRPFAGLLEKSYKYCKCKYCKIVDKKVRDAAAPKNRTRQKLKKSMEKEMNDEQ